MEIDWLLAHARPRSLPRGGVFCAIGQAEHEIGFLDEGILQVFALSPDGRKILLDFIFAGGVALALDSATKGLPSEVVFEAVIPCRLTVLPYHLRHAAVERHAGWERLATRMTEEMFQRKQQRHMSLRSKTARQRYAELSCELPEAWRSIPQHLIAAYLDITPQYLSTLKQRAEREIMTEKVRWSRFGGQIGGFAKLGSGVRYAAMSMPSQAVWTSSGVLPPRAEWGLVRL